MADFARMPTQRKALVLGAVAIVLGFGYYNFVFKSLKNDVEQAENEHETKLGTNKKLEGDIPKFEALKARMSQLKRTIEENQKALPTEAELPAFFETLNRKELESGVQVDFERKLPEQAVDNFVRVPVDIQLTGTFVEIKKFFASLVPKKKLAGGTQADDANVERERIVSIENISVTNPVVKNREIVLTVHFTASTYRQEDQVAAPPKPAAPRPAQPAGGAGAGSDKPLPPAATPQGAKARVEGAMDKSLNRTTNAPGASDATGGSAKPPKGGL